MTTLDRELDFIQEAGWAADKGIHRDHNEDTVVAINIEIADGTDLHSVGIYAVADGMGGHEHGDIASQLATQVATRRLITCLTEAPIVSQEGYINYLKDAVRIANDVVFHQNIGKPRNMGTTLVIALVIGQNVFIAHVGDSRAYHIFPDEILQLTEDQSFVQQLLNYGLITPEQAENHPHRHTLNSAIGMEETVQIQTISTVLHDDDYLLLCSDGLTRELDDVIIHKTVRDATSVQAACNALVAAANRSGGHDNISVVVINSCEARSHYR